MDRRLAGLLVLVLAITAVVVAPAIDGRRVAGAGVAAAFPAPPEVGACVLPPVPVGPKVGGLLPEIPVTAVHFGSCEGVIAGEVVSLLASDQVTGMDLSFPGPCADGISAFAGLQVSARSATVPGAPPDSPAVWTPTLGSTGLLIVPSQSERNTGRLWAACLVVPTMHSTYHGTLRHAFTAGRLPDQFGLCWAESDLDHMPDLLPCAEPHPAELLATGWIENRSVVTLERVEASCLDIAGRIMRTGDPGRGGAITIVTDPVRRDGASRPDAPLTVGCFATSSAGAPLTGTVIGLGDSPVPLAR